MHKVIYPKTMSKFAIILCVAIFATVANASFWSNEVQSIQNTVDSIVTTAISQIRAKFESAKQRALDKLLKLEEAAQKFSQKLTDDVSALLQNVRDEVKNMTQRANGTDVSECTGLVSELDNLAVQMFSEVSGCAIEKIKVGVNYVDSLKTTADSAHKRLSELRDEGLRCGYNVTGVRTTLQAVFCIRLVAAKATWTAAKSVPSISVNFAKIGYLLTTLQPSLSYCTTSKALVTLSHQSSNITKQVEKCVRKKITEATFNKTENNSDNKPTTNETASTTDNESTTTKSSKANNEHTVSPSSPNETGSSSKQGTSTSRPSEQTTVNGLSTEKGPGESESN